MQNKIPKLIIKNLEIMVIELFIAKIQDFYKKDEIYSINVPEFLINPKNIIIYWFKEHFAIEIDGHYDNKNKSINSNNDIKFSHQFFIDSMEETTVFSAITGNDIKKCKDTSSQEIFTRLIPAYRTIYAGGLFFTGDTFTKLIDLGWRIEVMNGFSTIFNFSESSIPKNVYANFQNIFIFNEDNGGISTNFIKWLEIFPYNIIFNDNKNIKDIQLDKNYFKYATKNSGIKPFHKPNTYQDKKFSIINNFICLWGRKSTKEIEITKYITINEHKFILTMHFGAINIYPELQCKILGDPSKSIRPDFFIEKSDGYCDIVEFKLPYLTKKLVVGPPNRRRFASWFSEYIAQTRTYRSYFNDIQNTNTVKEQHNIKVLNPTTTIVIGRRHDFNKIEITNLLSDYQNLRIINYDDLINGVVAQLYF